MFLIIISALVVIFVTQDGVGYAAPSADEIVLKASDRLKDIQTLQADVVAEYSDPSVKNPIKMTVRVSADRTNRLTRVEITQHAVLEGQIIILDAKKDIATVYMPVTGQAYRGKSQIIATQLGVDMNSFDLDQILALDPSGLMTFKYIRQDKIDRLPYYVLESKVTLSPQGYQVVWVDCETYMVRKVEAYDAQGKIIANILINGLKTNVKLDPKKLQELPKGTRVMDIK